MIVDFLLDLLTSSVTFFLGMLPDWNVDDLVTAGNSGAGHIGATLGHANAVVPVTELFTVLGLVTALIPVLIGYTVFKWVWMHIPTIAGFGTGNG